MKQLLTYLAIALLIGGYSFSVTAAQIALVIGNSNYEHEPLKNPANDAADVAYRLKRLGFDVIFRLNLSRRGMENAIHAFGKRLDYSWGDDTAVFYYSGHGTYSDQNYLIPIQSRNIRPNNLRYTAVPENLILAEMKRYNKKGANIFILDACRDNPHPGATKKGLTRKGLAPTLLSKTDMVIALATRAGNTVDDRVDKRNSLYTEQLLGQLKQAHNKPIKNVFRNVSKSVVRASRKKQSPTHIYSIPSNICFDGCFAY
ncbi:MAG: hypothetical protein DRR08_26025 [Candidatus Parabeggiatoa sp. nov. 2]|nr:MAG: hypothetical protein DRR08_26025 [Gammaproteobacteria bacterium]HEC84947.1 caspase family protein [Thioploca sp.]